MHFVFPPECERRVEFDRACKPVTGHGIDIDTLMPEHFRNIDQLRRMIYAMGNIAAGLEMLSPLGHIGGNGPAHEFRDTVEVIRFVEKYRRGPRGARKDRRGRAP